MCGRNEKTAGCPGYSQAVTSESRDSNRCTMPTVMPVSSRIIRGHIAIGTYIHITMTVYCYLGTNIQ